MAAPHRHPAGPTAALAVIAVAIVGAVCGCKTTVASHGLHETRAAWSPPVLSANLPQPVRATDVAAAAEAALRRMGYTVSQRHASDDRATVVGLSPGGTRLDRIVVKAEPDVREMRIEIITRGRPDEDRARITLDEILLLLGL